jgi:hypothetical protein
MSVCMDVGKYNTNGKGGWTTKIVISASATLDDDPWDVDGNTGIRHWYITFQYDSFQWDNCSVSFNNLFNISISLKSKYPI